MEAVLVALALVIMVTGLVGTVAPLLPGLVLIWAAGALSWWLAGITTPGWVAIGALTALVVVGTAAKYVLPARAGRSRAVAARSMAVGLALGVVGFFVIPVVGFAIGGLLGVFASEVRRTGDRDRAKDNTMAMLRSFGLGVLIESATGIAMIVVWLATVLVAGIT